VNELLCYVENNFTKHPKDLVGVAVVGFYTDEEVYESKQALFDFSRTLGDRPGLSRLKRPDKDNRRKLECENILNLFGALDAVKVQLPSHVAADLQRLSTVSPDAVDIYGLAAAVQKHSTQVNSLSKQVAEQKMVPALGKLMTRV